MTSSRKWVIGVWGLAIGIGLAAIIPGARAVAEKPEKGEDDPAAAQLEAIGGLSAVNAQHTYLLIGVLSDAFVKGVYEGNQVRTMSNGIVQQLATVSDMLEKVQDADLSDEDDEYVDKIVEIYSLLQDQAKALAKYTEERGEAEGRVFEKTRRQALQAIENLLGGDKPVEKPPEKSPEKPAEDEPRKASPAKDADQ